MCYIYESRSAMSWICHTRIIATLSIRFPHFLVDIHSQTPAAARLYVSRDRPLSPRFPYRIFIGRSSPSTAPGDIKHVAAARALAL